MSLYPIIWAVEHAPIVDAEERAILVALVTKGDFDGCNCYRSFATLARVARVDRRTAMRKVQAMTDRGVLRDQKDPPPQSWYALPADKRPVVREAMIPASFWSKVQLEEINEQRVTRGRAPIRAANRPDLGEAPPKKARADKGVPNPKRSKKKTGGERGVSQTPAPEQSGVSLSHLAEGLEDTSRGVSESPNLLIAPSSSPSPPAPAADVPQQRKEEKKKSFEEQATTLILERLTNTPGGPPTLEEMPKMLERIRSEAAKKGTPTIHNMHTWVTNRHDSALLADLEHVRHHAGGRNGARADVCGLHPGRKTLPCRMCTMAGKQGLVEYLEPELARVGADVRPDLAEALEVARAALTAAA